MDIERLRATVTIIGTAEETRVTIRPTAAIAGSDAIPDTEAGGELVFDIEPFEVVHLESRYQGELGDFSGTRVISDRPVAVFFAHRGAQIPSPVYLCPDGGAPDAETGLCCADRSVPDEDGL